jgi:hypothetical protein
MKRCILPVMAALAWGLCGPAIVVAQVRFQGAEIPGMFGGRSLGRPIAPGRSNSVSGIQTGPSGAFLYLGRSDGPNAFAAPWRRIELGPLPETTGSPLVMPQTAPVIPSLGPELYQPSTSSQAGPEEQYPAAPAGATTSPAASGTAPPTGTPTSVARPSAAAPSRVAKLHIAIGTRAVASTSASGQGYVRSPGLSDRLTRIARSNGMLAGPGIDVLLGNGTAVLRGCVHTGENRIVLANLIGLEPGVQQVDNGLVVEGLGEDVKRGRH